MKQKQEDRAMKIFHDKVVGRLVLFFCMVMSGVTFGHDSLVYACMMQSNMKLEMLKHELQEEPSADEKVVQELWGVVGSYYKKMIEITALYFTGVLSDSDQFHKQITFETGRHILYAGQIVAQYIPKLLNNPSVSWRVKVKRCAYVASFLIVVMVWMKECYQPYRHKLDDRMLKYQMRSEIGKNNFSVSYSENSFDHPPRQHPLGY
jgi:hypothetical protein